MEPSSPLRARLPSSFISHKISCVSLPWRQIQGNSDCPNDSHELQRQAALLSDIDWGIRLLLMATTMHGRCKIAGVTLTLTFASDSKTGWQVSGSDPLTYLSRRCATNAVERGCELYQTRCRFHCTSPDRPQCLENGEQLSTTCSVTVRQCRRG